MPEPDGVDNRSRCGWALHSSIERDYHDRQWGVPVKEDRKLFEMLVLEGAQAGLSWRTILSRRAAYQEAFDNFQAKNVAGYSAHDVERLLRDPGIIRNRLKIESAVSNAQRFLEIQQQRGGFQAYLWQFTGGKPVHNRWASAEDVPTRSRESDALAKDLKRRGFKFVGTTICYAYMQAIGMVNDHWVSCYRHLEIERLATTT